jgi:hypothetical protein
MARQGQGFQVEGPIVDAESGVREYTVRSGAWEGSFGVIPVLGGDGVTLWIMRYGRDRVVPEDPGFEPYETAEEAYEAGLRAARAAFEQAGGSP